MLARRRIILPGCDVVTFLTFPPWTDTNGQNYFSYSQLTVTA